MAYYSIEEEAWKCPKHPSKKRRNATGVCSVCLRDRLSKLCPHCANVRPCSSNCAAAGKVGGGEAVYCRLKSVGIPFLKLRNDNSGDQRRSQLESEKINKTASSSSSSDKINIGGGKAALCRSKSVGIPFLKSRNDNSGDRRRSELESEKSKKMASSSSSSGKMNVGGGEAALRRSKSVGIPFLKLRNDNSGGLRSLPEIEKSNKTTSSSSSSGKIIIGSGEEEAFCRSKSVGIPFLKLQNDNSGGLRNLPEREKSNKTKLSSSSSVKINIGGGEAALFRSKSVGIQFLKSRNDNSGNRRNLPESEKSNKTASFWWIFRRKGKENELESMMVMRSRSVNVAMTSVSGTNDVSYSPEKLKG